jgi:hypothetical protein
MKTEDKFIRDLLGEPEAKRPLGGHRRRWENNITVNFLNFRSRTLIRGDSY